jgi:Uma2 family endonuclease
MLLTIEDFEKVQTKLAESHLDYRMELVDGKIIIMGLSDYLSEEVIGYLLTALTMWVKPRKLGRVTGSGAGFRLPDGDLKGPDVSFVSASRMPESPRTFAKLVPDLMVEVKSSTDRLKPLEEKIQAFLELGTQVGILIDPDKLTVTIYRPNSEPVILTSYDSLTVPELLPGWEMPISELWPPVFE